MPVRMDRRAAVGLLAAGLGGPVLGAIGHALSPEHADHGDFAAVSPLTLLALAVAMVAGLLLLRPSGRRILALAFVAILTVLAFETALHSVHHLDEPDAGASCPVLTAASQVNGISPAVSELSLRSDTPGLVIGVELAWLLPFCSPRVPEGRAPPAPPSA
jgi:hypothetical protein